MKLSSLPLALLVTLALPLPRAGADVIDVRGPSPDYDQIVDAVNAAQDGDVVRIWPGHYGAFWIEDKALTLVRADPSGAVIVDGTYRIKNLAAHRSVEVCGVDAHPADGHALVVSGCRGSVRIRDGEYVAGDTIGSIWDQRTNIGVYVIDCDDVELSSCSAMGSIRIDQDFCYGFRGNPGLAADSSRVSLYDSTFEGYGGGDGIEDGYDGGRGGHGVEAWGEGCVYLSGCLLIGGDGGDSPPDFGECGWGGSGGWGYYGHPYATPHPEAWFLDDVYQPGLGGDSCTSGQDGSDGQDTSLGTHLSGDARLLTASPLIDDGSTIDLVFRGTPGDLVCLQVADSPDYAFAPLRGPFLLATRDLPDLRPWRILGTMGATGVFTVSLPVAGLPAFGQHVKHLQGNLIGAENYFTSSTWTVILDGAW